MGPEGKLTFACLDFINLLFCSGKEKEIDAGADGFLVYDIGLVEPMQQVILYLRTNVLHDPSLGSPPVAHAVEKS